MNKRVIDILFVIILLSPPFKFANRIFALPGFITGPFTNDLVASPLLIGIIYTLYCQYKYGNVLVGWKRFKKYILIYLAVLLVSLIWGLLSYPYFDMLFNGPVSDTGKFAKVMGLLSHVGIHLNQEFSMSIWILMRSVKTILLNLLYTFGGAYMIYCWYHDRVERALQLLKNVTVGFLVLLAAYGLVEVCYQNGQMWAQNFLQFMWPILHSNPHPDQHFYPALMGARVRSFFLEASYFGIYLTFALPILWWKIVEEKGIRRAGLCLLYLILAFELYLMQSRSATAFFIGELLLMAIGTLYLRDRKLCLPVAGIFAGALIAFGGAMYFLENYQIPVPVGSYGPVAMKRIELEKKGLWPRQAKPSPEQNAASQQKAKASPAPKQKSQPPKNNGAQNKGGGSNQAENYVNSSLVSLVNTDKAKNRADSNHVRYGITIANVEIGLHHNPILGVGSGLDAAYFYEKFQNDKNGEIQRYIKQVKKDGLLQSGSPVMCDYTSQFMQTGIVGLALFVVPALYVLFRLLTLFLKSRADGKKPVILLFVIIADIGIAITGFSNTLNITYCYWLMLGLSYSIYFHYKGIWKENLITGVENENR